MNPFQLPHRKSDLTEELNSHLNLAIADRISRGESPEAARANALREFGNLPLVADDLYINDNVLWSTRSARSRGTSQWAI